MRLSHLFGTQESELKTILDESKTCQAAGSALHTLASQHTTDDLLTDTTVATSSAGYSYASECASKTTNALAWQAFPHKQAKQQSRVICIDIVQEECHRAV